MLNISWETGNFVRYKKIYIKQDVFWNFLTKVGWDSEPWIIEASIYEKLENIH